MGKNNKGDYDARVAVKNLRDVTARFDNRHGAARISRVKARWKPGHRSFANFSGESKHNQEPTMRPQA